MIVFILLLSAVLFGIGMGIVFYRRNFFGLLMGFVICQTALMLAMVSHPSKSSDNSIFVMVLLAFQIFLFLISGAMLYRKSLYLKGSQEENGRDPVRF